MALPLQAWVEKTVHGVEIHILSGKEKVLGNAVSKEDHASSVLGSERTHDYLFPWKGATVKSASYCQVFSKIHFNIE